MESFSLEIRRFCDAVKTHRKYSQVRIEQMKFSAAEYYKFIFIIFFRGQKVALEGLGSN